MNVFFKNMSIVRSAICCLLGHTECVFVTGQGFSMTEYVVYLGKIADSMFKWKIKASYETMGKQMDFHWFPEI